MPAGELRVSISAQGGSLSGLARAGPAPVTVAPAAPAVAERPAVPEPHRCPFCLTSITATPSGTSRQPVPWRTQIGTAPASRANASLSPALYH
jgi:hypothetical protein